MEFFVLLNYFSQQKSEGNTQLANLLVDEIEPNEPVIPAPVVSAAPSVPAPTEVQVSETPKATETPLENVLFHCSDSIIV